MVKVYFTYNYTQTVGQSTSRLSNFVYDPTHRLFVAGVNQYIALISPKTGEVEKYLGKQGKNIPVRLVYIYAGNIYAGYEDGEILVWSLTSHEQLHSFDLHKSTVSSICLYEQQSKLISGGFDGHIMIWDTLSQECQTIKSAHPSMITQIAATSILHRGKPTPIIISVGKDGFLRVWDMKSCLCLASLSCQVTEIYCMYLDPIRNIVYVGTNKEDIVVVEFNEGNSDDEDKRVCWIRGVTKKKSVARTNQIYVEHSTMYVFNADNNVEVYELLTDKEIKARKKRVQSRRKKGGDIEEPVQEADLELKFKQQKIVPFKFHNAQVHDGSIYLNNGSNIFDLNTDKQLTTGIGRTQQLILQYPFIAQRSSSTINVYSSSTVNKLFSIPVKAQWCQIFSGGFLMVVEASSVQIWDLSKDEEVYRLEDKWSGCWVKKNKCLLWRQNQLGVFQIGYDKNKKIKMKKEDSRKFEDKIIEAGYKHNMDKYIVNLQNSQLHINYSDTHKSFLKLYGHKMPVLSFDVSTDDALLATGSIDKDIRIWDMDFGQSIKSIFAHQEPVTIVRFIPETHYLLSGGKDGHLKYWDMDTYQLIMDFEESTMEIKGLAISGAGDFVIAGGLDDGFRVWKQTNDQTIATDMEDKQMQKVMIEDYAQQKLDQNETKTKYEDLKHGEQIIEAIQNKETPSTLLTLLKKIPPANLKSCLSFLHERHIRLLESYLKIMIDGGYQQQTCWRVIKQLNRGTHLGKDMREVWKPVGKLVQLNTQILKTWLNYVKDVNELIA